MNPQDKNTEVAFWLVPARADTDFLAELIQALATRYKALLFEPHVTIFSTDAALLGSPETVLKTAVEEVYAFPLTVAGCGYTGEFNKTFFIQCVATSRGRQATALGGRRRFQWFQTSVCSDISTSGRIAASLGH